MDLEVLNKNSQIHDSILRSNSKKSYKESLNDEDESSLTTSASERAIAIAALNKIRRWGKDEEERERRK